MSENKKAQGMIYCKVQQRWVYNCDHTKCHG